MASLLRHDAQKILNICSYLFWPNTPHGIYAAVAALNGSAFAAVPKTTYPVVFAHGMAGFDDLLGYSYWGDDYAASSVS
jgi:hypothetical protein